MKRIAVILLLSSFFMSGCLLTSFNPFYKKTDLTTNDLLVGNWIGKNALLTFSKMDELGYLLNYKDCEDPYNAPNDFSTCTMADFSVHLMKLGDNFYMDFHPRNFSNTDNLFSNLHIKTTHSLGKVAIEKNSLEVRMLNYSWMLTYLENNKDKLAHIKTDDMVTLTASTDELQAFISKHEKDAGFFDNAVILRRK